MVSIEINTTITVAGTIVLQYFPHLITYPCFAAVAIPTTFADAPIGVALPPMSVPMASVYASTPKSTPCVAAKVSMIGTIVAANGILSTNALAMAEIQMMIAIISLIFPPLIFPIKSAIITRIPVSSRPPTTINNPIKNSNVL